MNKLIVGLTVSILTVATAHAQTCRSDGFGGYRCDNGINARPDGFGGWRNSDGTRCRPDGFGGFRCD